MLVSLQLFNALIVRVRLKPKGYCSVLDTCVLDEPLTLCRAVTSNWLCGFVFDLKIFSSGIA